MFSSRWFLLMVVIVIGGLVAGATLIEKVTINHLRYQDAVANGRNWTEYLAANIDDLDSIASGKEPSTKSRAFFDQGKRVGQVFLYKIYDAEGHPGFVSDDLPQGASEDEDLAAHNSEAANAVQAGRPLIKAEEGEPPARPPFFSEAYVPVIQKGKFVAVVETYIDQTQKRAEFQGAFFGATIGLGLIIAGAFGFPAAAWYFRDKQKHQADQRIAYLAKHDAMTGLLNRTELSEALTRKVTLTPPEKLRLAVHCIDLDNFKDINDTLGHNAGDTLIKSVAKRLSSIAASDDIVARLDGDEFAIIQLNPIDGINAESFAKRVTNLLAAPFWIDGQEVRATACVGVALAPDHGADASRLLQSANLALNKGKADGRAEVCLFDPIFDEELYQRLTLERAIERALEDDGFELHFQPQYRPLDNRLVGFEALLRLPTAEGGFIPPAVFIPAAEEMGLIGQIGAWVIERASATAAAWPEHLMIAVNLSPAQFGAGNLGEIVATALKKTGLKSERLELEITESLLIEDTDKVMSELAAIGKLGVAIVMDDFGTGYSSLNYLWRFPFKKIKIDRSFIAALDRDDGAAQKVIRTIITLGHSLGMRVNVEGVETSTQAHFVAQVGCDEVQGFFFGRPTPATDLAGLIMTDFQSVGGKIADSKKPELWPASSDTAATG